MDKLFRFLFRSISIFYSTLLFKMVLLFYKYQIPKNLKIDGYVFIKSNKNAKIIIGDNFKLNSRKASNLVGITNSASFQLLNYGQIIIGNNCGFTSTVFSAKKLIKIGNYVKIGGNTRIFDHDFHSINSLDRRDINADSMNAKVKPIIIEDDVFIGTNVIILKGTRIGKRSVVAAGSVIFGLDIPDDSLVLGNPASVIKKLDFNEV